MKKGWIIAIVSLLVLVTGGFAAWYFVLRSDAPQAFDIDTVGTGPMAEGAAVLGTWSVGQSPTGEPSAAGYRVSERFAGGAVDVDGVGRSEAVVGEMVITQTEDGMAVTATTVTVDTRKLKSDKAQRDAKLRTQGLETDRFPEATFTLTEPIPLSDRGTVTRIPAVGNLTIHGVTRPVTMTIDATQVGEVIAVVGSTTITMADFEITPPSIPGFVTVADTGTLEMQLFFVRA